jgi:hypothetical protein
VDDGCAKAISGCQSGGDKRGTIAGPKGGPAEFMIKPGFVTSTAEEATATKSGVVAVSGERFGAAGGGAVIK